MEEKCEMKAESLVTIIVPVYNVEKYVGRCFTSIINQTYFNLEILVVVDLDCDIDESAAICMEYEKRDSRVRIINQKNCGLSGARNAALDLSTGEYVMFVDGDDFIDRHMVENLYHAAQKECADLSIGGYEDFFGGAILGYIEANGRVISRQAAFEMLVDKKYSTCMRTAWGKLYKRTLFDGLRYREHSYCEDMLIIHEILDRSDIIVYDPAPYYYYVQENMNSLDRSEFNMGKTAYLEATGCWRDLAKRKYPSVYEKAEIFHIGSIADILYAMRSIKEGEKVGIQTKYIEELRYKKNIWKNSKELTVKDKVRIFAAINQWWWLYDLYHQLKKERKK